MKNILFDLDGTLLPMDEDAFTKTYFGYLCQKMAPYGFEPQRLVKTIWKGTEAMYGNDGRCSNEDAFWKCYQNEYNEPKEKNHQHFVDFYADEFNKAITTTSPTPLARQIIDVCHDKGLNVILATNPLFPRVGTINRIRWAGLNAEDFELITTYENSHYCKPNPDYYREIAEKLSLDPRETLMVGNDADEDTAAEKLKMNVFLITDCLINKSGRDINVYPNGGFCELIEYLENKL